MKTETFIRECWEFRVELQPVERERERKQLLIDLFTIRKFGVSKIYLFFFSKKLMHLFSKETVN